jgi:adenylate cyclase
MSIEIERKFLVEKEIWDIEKQNHSNKTNMIQGYILSVPDKTIRVRSTETKGFITIKGPTVGISKPEYEYEIPLTDSLELINNFATSIVEKIRYNVYYKGKKWEIDEFLGKNKGLVIAEIELKAESDIFETPTWVGKEVTSDEKYFNSNLAKNAPDFEYNDEELFLRCECSTEGFYISKEVEVESPLYWFCRYKIDNFYDLSFKNKLKMIYKLLKTGKCFDNELILNKNNAKKLSDFLK